MIGRVVGAVTLLFVSGCAGVQQQQSAEIIRDAQIKLQAITQNCEQRMEADRDLDPIRAKVELIRTGVAGAPPPGILSNQSRPSPEERQAIGKWAAMREACVQEEMRYGLSLSLPPNLQAQRDQLVLAGRRMNEQVGLLVAALYGGQLTYGQFAARRMQLMDQAMAPSSTGSAASSPNTTRPLAGTAALEPSRADEIRLTRQGNSYVLPVMVNGLPPMNFLLDTGSSDVALPAELVFTLLRTGTLQPNDFIGDKNYVLADGRELPSPAFKIRELRVGQHVIRGAVGHLSPAGTDPLLGGSFLSRFASWSIDNQRNLLVLAR